MSHAGVALVVELADRVGLTAALSGALAGSRERRSAHDPGRVLRDVAVMLADGGDCVTDIDAYRGQERLFGARASETTTHRVLKSIDEQLLARLRGARAAARARVWDAGARPESITLDIDATLLTAHAEKERAAGNYKHGYGFHPLGCWLDETGEALAAILRPGNAGSNTAEDHFTVLGLALEQLPAEALDREILVRTDSGGCTHAFTADCRDAQIRFSDRLRAERNGPRRDPRGPGNRVAAGDRRRWGSSGRRVGRGADRPSEPDRLARGMPADRPARAAASRRAVRASTNTMATASCPDRPGRPDSALELRAPHRGRARVEDSIRAGKDTGMGNLPLHDFEHNQAWLEISLIAQDLLTWTKRSALTVSWRLPSPSDCATGCFTPPPVGVHGRRTRLRLQAAGHGRPRSSPRSRGSRAPTLCERTRQPRPRSRRPVTRPAGRALRPAHGRSNKHSHRGKPPPLAQPDSDSSDSPKSRRPRRVTSRHKTAGSRLGTARRRAQVSMQRAGTTSTNAAASLSAHRRAGARVPRESSD